MFYRLAADNLYGVRTTLLRSRYLTFFSFRVGS